MSDVIVVGGGIIGLLTARELLAAGCSVRLLDKQEPGREASWAGGGIVSPLYPWNYDDAITELVTWAQAYYPVLADELKESTGIDPEFNPCGLFMLDSPEYDKALAWAARTKAKLSSVPVSDVYDKVRGLKEGFTTALSMPLVGNVRNPRILKALVKDLQANPKFKLHTNEAVIAFDVSANSVNAVKTDAGSYSADKVLIAAGAWSPLLADTLNQSLQIEPVKGEMLVFEPKPGLLNTMVLHDGKYLIPRRDGRIVVGSTTDRVGYQKQTTEIGHAALLNAVEKLLPELASCRVEKHWAGLRPGAPAGLPYMGESPVVDGLYICAGHYRNGLVTAPASARLMADLMLARNSEIDSEPFRLDRQAITEEMY